MLDWPARRAYPKDISDEERLFVAPYLCLLPEDCEQRVHSLREAVDTLGYLLALHVTPANEQERKQVDVLAEAVQKVTGENVQHAWVDQDYTGPEAADAATQRGIHLEVVKLAQAKKGFVLRWSSVPSAGSHAAAA